MVVNQIFSILGKAYRVIKLVSLHVKIQNPVQLIL